MTEEVVFPFESHHEDATYHKSEHHRASHRPHSYGPIGYEHELRFEDDDYDSDTHRQRLIDEDEHTFNDREDERLFTLDHYNEAPEENKLHAQVPHHILSAATNVFLDTTVTKFLQNDISVTKFLETSNDITVTKFLDTTVTKFLDENDISVTKFLAQKPDDISVTKFLNSMNLEAMADDISVTKYLEMTIIQFLGTSTAKFLDLNDISVTKFLSSALNNFLLDDAAVSELLVP